MAIHIIYTQMASNFEFFCAYEYSAVVMLQLISLLEDTQMSQQRLLHVHSAHVRQYTRNTLNIMEKQGCQHDRHAAVHPDAEVCRRPQCTRSNNR